jgi:DNA-binding Lrp family transcriptional regulator
MKEPSKLDDIDKKILNELQANSRISNVDLAEKVDLSPPAVHTRIKRLEQQGYINQYTAILNREKLGYDMVCFVGVRLELHHKKNVEAFHQALQEMPEVLECHFLTGEHDYLLKVAVQNRQEIEAFLVQRLSALPGIARISTSIVLTEIKNTTVIAL